ncbi:MAG: OmpA family protein [Bacteroidales bacterium]|nr:OmpA family protein [Bacteroidales bacterium]
MNFRFVHPILTLLLLFALFSCKTASIKKADAHFETGNYDAALAMYQKKVLDIPYTKPALKSEIYLKMGICAEVLQRMKPAETNFNNALRLKSQDPQLRLHLGQLYHRQGRYAEAIKQYKSYLEKDSANQLALNGIIGCQLADSLKKHVSRIVVKPEPKLNSKQGEYSPMLFGKEFDQIFFTTYRDKATGKQKSEITGSKNGDIFFSKKNNIGQWEEPKPAAGSINSENDEGAVSFNADNNLMYVTRCKTSDAASPADIYQTKRSDATWGELQKVKILRDSSEMSAHAAISPKSDWLYFVSDRKGGFGGNDIWRVALDNGKVTALENLGADINTAGNEMFPYIRENGELYFASNGLPGLGGLDLFRAIENSDGHWSVENLGIPINSNGDDFGITFAGLDENGYFSTNRADGKGFDHIYSFELPSIKLFAEFSVKSGKEILPEAGLHIVSDNGLNSKVTTKKDGTFKMKVEKGHKYQILASYKGYINATKIIEVATVEKDATYKNDFDLIPIAKPIQINNIFYDVNQATLRSESTQSLNELVKLLRENAHITIELSAHTDMNGSDEYNQRLSDERAASVVNFLIAAGIEKDRLTPKGYGKSTPKVVNATIAAQYKFLNEGDELTEEFILKLNPAEQEIANQINRRTEFRVLKTTYNLF